jgi:hypothetical protein
LDSRGDFGLREERRDDRGGKDETHASAYHAVNCGL